MTVSLFPLLVFLLLYLQDVNTVTIPDPTALGEQEKGYLDPGEEIGNPGDEIIKRVNVTNATSDENADKAEVTNDLANFTTETWLQVDRHSI
jgi:hypothetical protein